MAPLATQQYDMKSAMANLGLGNFNGSVNVSASFTGHGADLEIASGSVDDTGTYVFEVEPEGAGPSDSKQVAYWTTANGFDTMYSLWNPTSAAEDLTFTFYYGDGSGSYVLPVHLAANGSTMIDVMMLIESQQPDANGHMFPMTETTGSAIIRDTATGTLKTASGGYAPAPLTLVAAGGSFNVETATCGVNCITCCGQSAPAISPNPIYCPVGEGMQCTGTSTDCNGGVSYPSLTWSSSDTTVMTVDSGGVVTGVAPGSATIIAQFASSVIVNTGQICSSGSPSCQQGTPAGSASANVTPTVSVSGPSDVPLCSGCPSNGVDTIQLSASGNPSGGTFSWSTTSGNVNLSNTASSTVTVTSAAASTSQADTPVEVTYTYNSQQGTSTSWITVQKPSVLIIQGSDTTTSESSCTTTVNGQQATGCGVTRTFTYQVLDQIGGGAPIDFAGMQVWDAITISSTNNQLGLTGMATTCTDKSGGTNGGPCGATTNSSGEFSEGPPNGTGLSVCSTVCYSSGTCVAPSATTTALQTIYVNGFAVQTQTLTLECNKILVNGG